MGVSARTVAVRGPPSSSASCTEERARADLPDLLATARRGRGALDHDDELLTGSTFRCQHVSRFDVERSRHAGDRSQLRLRAPLEQPDAAQQLDSFVAANLLHQSSIPSRRLESELHRRSERQSSKSSMSRHRGAAAAHPARRATTLEGALMAGSTGFPVGWRHPARRARDTRLLACQPLRPAHHGRATPSDQGEHEVDQLDTRKVLDLVHRKPAGRVRGPIVERRPELPSHVRRSIDDPDEVAGFAA